MDRQSDPSSVETVAVVPHQSTSSFAEEGRFVPGTLLGGRYRIIALLGRGGMGEVYRATHLTLGQSVALKFLPEEAARDQRLLERFHGEVRIARQVSHPNVCRVYDIGEVEGMPFLSMEYVDGEDLAALLTRIGRLPADKALETARKICAGLAAAHDRGVIHRDLKPQNIMLNKRGEVLIMDFGLAAIADQLSGGEVRNGTPAYMAPEQLKAAEVTSKSDLYALGLVLYELFTGRRPFEAKTVRQMLDQQEALQLTSMSSIAPEIDQSVERVIRRCLEPDPGKRPATALSVAAALPGGDPLAAALAAGETPSPELIAAAGETIGLAKRYSVPCVLLVLACLAGSLVLRDRTDAMTRASLDYPPEALAVKSRELAAAFGYPKKPADSTVWLTERSRLMMLLKAQPNPKWDEWLAAEPPVMSEYRESQEPLVAFPFGEVSHDNPAPNKPGMVQVRLNAGGNLRDFSAVPLESAGTATTPVTPESVFHSMGFDMAAFTETAPVDAPPNASDQLRAWKGTHPRIANLPLTIEMATWQGRLTWATVVFPKQKQAADAALHKLIDAYPLVLIAAGLAVAAILARRNWKLGRVDRNGALWVGSVSCLLFMAGWIGDVHAVPSGEMALLLYRAAANWLFYGAMLALVYLALEPAVRARWPHSLMTWNRLLAGRWRDPQVASHVLIGAAIGCGLWIAFKLFDSWINGANDISFMGALSFTLGPRQWVGGYAYIVANAIRVGLFAFLVISGLRALMRNVLPAAVVASLLFTFTEGSVVNSPHWQMRAGLYLVVYFIIAFVLLRFGLVATMAVIFFANGIGATNLGLDWKTWYAPSGLASLALLVGVALFAFWKSLGAEVAETG